MGLDFDIIGENGKLIDRHCLGWLGRNYNENFCMDYRNTSINNIIDYCDKEINKLLLQKNKLLNILDCLNEKKFIERKNMIINLLSQINEIEEFDLTIEYLSEHTLKYLSEYSINNSKISTDYHLTDTNLSNFESLKKFLLKYNNQTRYEFTC